MGNQHGTARLAWLAGILDGEGSFMLTRHRRKDRDPGYTPRISIANTEPLIIEECKDILTGLGIRFCYYEQDKRVIGGRQRITLLLHVTNRIGVIKLLNAVLPFIVGKRKQAERLRTIAIGWPAISTAEKELHHAKMGEMNRRIPLVGLVDSSEAKSTAAL